MVEKVGIEQLKEVADGVLAYEALAVEVWKDGVADMKDVPMLLAKIPAVASATYLAIKDVDKAWPELKDLDGAEGAELVAHIATKLSVPDEKAKKIVAAILKMAVHLGSDIVELSQAIRQ